MPNSFKTGDTVFDKLNLVSPKLHNILSKMFKWSKPMIIARILWLEFI